VFFDYPSTFSTLVNDVSLLANITLRAVPSRHRKGFESLINFKICFNLDVAVMLEPVTSLLVGLANGQYSLWLKVWAAEAL